MLSSFISDTLASIRFLSRLPLPEQSDASPPDFAKIARAFPIAGLFIALPAALTLWASLALGLPTTISALLATICMVITTGALHEDGLADVADGFYGGHTVSQRLKIMRDSHIGTYGTLALILAVGLKVSLLAAIANNLAYWQTAFVFICAAGLSRAAMLYPWSHLAAARPSTDDKKDSAAKDKSGLSVRYGSPEKGSYYQAAFLSLPILAVLYLTAGWWPMVLGLVFLKLSTLAMTQLSRQKIGGHTGDTLGATQQISELGLLLGLTIVM